jgi:hypothetical protein
MMARIPAALAALTLLGPQLVAATCPWAESTHLSVRQVRSRLASKPQMDAPLLWSSMRITDAPIVFRVLVDETGKIGCAHAQQGHPIILSAALDSIKKWKFRPLDVDHRPRAFSGYLVLRISYSKHRLTVVVLKELPESIKSNELP